jgi:hypothetical protein
MEQSGVSSGGTSMPDWLTHSLIGWITGKISKQEVGLVVIGSLLPDINKLYLVFDWMLQQRTASFFLPIHTPLGAVLIASCMALFFQDIKRALIPLTIGIATHFLFDIVLLDVSGGIPLLFPFSWEEWEFTLIRSNDLDYSLTLYVLLVTVIIYILYFIYQKRKNKQNQNVV